MKHCYQQYRDAGLANHAAFSSHDETHKDRLAQMLVDMQEGMKSLAVVKTKASKKPEKIVRIKVEGLI